MKRRNDIEVVIPQDVEVVKNSGPWVFYFSESDNSLYVETTDYHAGPLRLTMENLQEFITILDKARAKKDLQTAVEASLVELISKDSRFANFSGTAVKLLFPNEQEKGEQ